MIVKSLYGYQSDGIYPELDNLINKDNSKGNEFTMTELLNIIKRNDPNELYKLKFINHFVNGHPTDGDRIGSYYDNGEMVIIIRCLIRIDKISHDIFKVYCEFLELFDGDSFPFSLKWMINRVRRGFYPMEFHSNYTLNFYSHLRGSLVRDMKFLNNIPPTLVREFNQILLNCKESGIMPVEVLESLDLNFIEKLGKPVDNLSMNDFSNLSKVRNEVGDKIAIENYELIINLSREYELKYVISSLLEFYKENIHF